MDKWLEAHGIEHILIPPRTPWHNGKVERSHRNDQRYFYDWEHFRSVDELNEKLRKHLIWSNNKTSPRNRMSPNISTFFRLFLSPSPLTILTIKLPRIGIRTGSSNPTLPSIIAPVKNDFVSTIPTLHRYIRAI